MYLFVLGRQPEIGLAELVAVFGNAELVLPQVALVQADADPDINRLGGVRKVARVIWHQSGDASRFLIKRFADLPQGKITLGVSQYGRSVSSGGAQRVALYIKKHLDRSVRVLPNSSAEIADAATLGNRLGTSPNKIELLMAHVRDGLVIAELIGVQDINAYTFRDRSRPRRDARVGMLPPKLAQTMINLAVGFSTAEEQASRGRVLLDPFCGTGVVLQEAALLGFSVYGSDIEPRMIDYTEQNLDWLERTHHMAFDRRLEVGDATDHRWRPPIDFVVCETYLGTPYANQPTPEKLRQNIRTCNTIIEKFLVNITPQLKPGTRLCIAVPVWFLNSRTYHLPLVTQQSFAGLTANGQAPLVYRREDQVVGRELLVLCSK
jgi:tRNA (guanine10-N2)-dimethyltransferase